MPSKMPPAFPSAPFRYCRKSCLMRLDRSLLSRMFLLWPEDRHESSARENREVRNDLGLTGTKEGCGEGECGSCCVLLDGMLVNSCLIPVAQANGVSVVTIEGMSAHNLMKPLQEAFLQCGGAQCGICTPGMILAAVHLLEKKPELALADILEGLAGNLCPCTGYMQIFAAIAHAARQRAAQ